MTERARSSLGRGVGGGLLLLPRAVGRSALVGAWLVHALVAVPVAALALGVLWGTAAADHALEPSPGERRPRWPLLLSAPLAILAALLLNAWLNQL